MRYEKTDNPSYVIDKNTGAIINNNNNELAEYKQKLEIFTRIASLENDIKDIKHALNVILGKITNG